MFILSFQRIDLRNNKIRLTGMEALNSAMKKNKSITKIDLDDKPDIKMVSEQLHFYCLLEESLKRKKHLYCY